MADEPTSAGIAPRKSAIEAGAETTRGRDCGDATKLDSIKPPSDAAFDTEEAEAAAEPRWWSCMPASQFATVCHTDSVPSALASEPTAELELELEPALALCDNAALRWACAKRRIV